MAIKSSRTHNPLVTLKSSPIHGKGLFAKADIAKGARIIEYVGERITKREAEHRAETSLRSNREDQSNGAVYIFELNKRHDIDGNVSYNLARHINHSCDPNSETEIIRGKIWVIALRDIVKGEEIFYNYGYDFEDYEHHLCSCGASRCVGFIMAEEYWPQLKEMRSALKQS